MEDNEKGKEKPSSPHIHSCHFMLTNRSQCRGERGNKVWVKNAQQKLITEELIALAAQGEFFFLCMIYRGV